MRLAKKIRPFGVNGGTGCKLQLLSSSSWPWTILKSQEPAWRNQHVTRQVPHYASLTNPLPAKNSPSNPERRANSKPQPAKMLAAEGQAELHTFSLIKNVQR